MLLISVLFVAALTDSAKTNDLFKEIEMKQRKQAWSNGANDFAPEILATGADDATYAVVCHHGAAITAAYFTIEHTTPITGTGVIDVDTLN